MSRYLWMAVTADEYELPLAVETSAKKLADLIGVSVSTVKGCEFRDSDGHISGRRFVKVRNDETICD